MQGRLALQLRGRSTKTLEIFRPRIQRARRGAAPRQHAEIMATNRFDPLQPQQSPGWDICSTCGAARRVLGHASSLDRAPAATACVRDWAGNSAGGEPSPTPARPLHERPVQEGMFCAANEFTGQIRARKCVVGSPRHVWTRTRRRGSGTDTGTPARLSWHRKPSSPGPSGAHLRCRDSARPRDVCEPAAGTACARRAPGSELWDRLTHPRPRCPHESPCARTVAALWPTELHAPRHRRRFRVSFSPSHEKWRPLPESAGRIGPSLCRRLRHTPSL